jgi:uncharacterized membrane protein
VPAEAFAKARFYPFFETPAEALPFNASGIGRAAMNLALLHGIVAAGWGLLGGNV